MDINKLLDETKKELGVDTDYKLAKALEMNNGRVRDYRSKKMRPDAYAATRIAIILNRDPIQLIAEIESETERNEKKRGFWERFLSHSRTAALSLVAGLIFTLGYGAGAASPDGLFARRRYFA